MLLDRVNLIPSLLQLLTPRRFRARCLPIDRLATTRLQASSADSSGCRICRATDSARHAFVALPAHSRSRAPRFASVFLIRNRPDFAGEELSASFDFARLRPLLAEWVPVGSR